MGSTIRNFTSNMSNNRTYKNPGCPVELWQKMVRQFTELSAWLESHPQREDLYSALRPVLAELPRQELTFLDVIDKLQPSLRTAQLFGPETLKDFDIADGSTSWFIPSVTQLLPNSESIGCEGVSTGAIQAALKSSALGLRIVGYPTAVLRDLSIILLPVLLMTQNLAKRRVFSRRAKCWKNCPNGRTLMEKRC